MWLITLPLFFRTDQQTSAMVALSPLPLDNLPHSTADETKLELDTEAIDEEHSAAITTVTVGSNRNGATSPSLPLYPLSSPSSTSAAPNRSTRPRLSNSWSTSLSHSPCMLSASSSSRGQFSTSPQYVSYCCCLRLWEVGLVDLKICFFCYVLLRCKWAKLYEMKRSFSLIKTGSEIRYLQGHLWSIFIFWLFVAIRQNLSFLQLPYVICGNESSLISWHW